MVPSERRVARWRPVFLFILVHVVAFALLGWLAYESSRARPELSPQGAHLRLIPLNAP